MTRAAMTGVGVVIMSGWIGATLLGQTAATKKEPNLSTDKGKETTSTAVAQLQRAGDLVQYAREYESPVAMLAAVQMLQRVRVQEGAEHLKGGPEGDAKGAAGGDKKEKGKTPAPTLDAKALLAEARAWAKGNASLLALLDAEGGKSQPGTLGGVPGPYRQPGRLHARKYKDWSVVMRGGELAKLVVLGDGDTDLDLEVFDENGNLIVRDIDYTDQCVVEWTPKWTGRFTVRITNLGFVYNDYILLSN